MADSPLGGGGGQVSAPCCGVLVQHAGSARLGLAKAIPTGSSVSAKPRFAVVVHGTVTALTFALLLLLLVLFCLDSGQCVFTSLTHFTASP